MVGDDRFITIEEYYFKRKFPTSIKVQTNNNIILVAKRVPMLKDYNHEVYSIDHDGCHRDKILLMAEDVLECYNIFDNIHNIGRNVKTYIDKD